MSSVVRSVFVSEYLCGGAWPTEVLPESLAAEGRAMIEALVTDFSALPDVTVLTTWDRRLAPPSFLSNSNVQTHWVQNPGREREIFDQLTAVATATLIIAPEFDSILEQRCLQTSRNCEKNLPVTEDFISAHKSSAGFVETSESVRRKLNSTPAAIRLCADKLAVYELCRQLGIPAIHTCGLRAQPQGLPCIVKRRDGAGSLGMQLISTRKQWQQWRLSVAPEQYIEQPWFAGTPCSVAALVHAGRVNTLFPVALQNLSTEGTFRYLGGTIPAPGIELDWLKPAVLRLVEAIPGLSGYIGFDFLIGSRSKGISLAEETRLVEINPRLCTSYIGYRKLCTQNLAKWLLDPQQDAVPEFTGSVTFEATEELSSPEKNVSASLSSLPRTHRD